MENEPGVASGGVQAGPRPWQRALYEVIFGTETRAGAAFDVALLVAIGISVAATLLESVASIRAIHGAALFRLELALTVLFTIELALRCLCVRSVKRYLFSFFGVVDVWAVVTLTTVGYGDIAPQTPLGQAAAILVMIIGYSIIAVPTDIVSVELAEASRQARVCPGCGRAGHQSDAAFCRHCGAAMGE